MKIGHIEIKDSLQFTGCSLDKLVSDLREMGQKEQKTLQETFPTTYAYFKKEWSHISEDVFEMVTRKGIYPYEYIDSWDKFKENKLAQKLWEKFQLQDIGQLHDLYMNTDVMLLADVFESFRNKAMERSISCILHTL